MLQNEVIEEILGVNRKIDGNNNSKTVHPESSQFTLAASYKCVLSLACI